MRRKQTKNIDKIQWTKKSTLRLITVAVLLVIANYSIVKLPEKLRENKFNQYDGETMGSVISIESNEINDQGFEGGKVVIISYTITYNYSIDGKTITNKNTIPNRGKYKSFIRELYDSNFKKECIIIYNSINPQKSMLLIE